VRRNLALALIAAAACQGACQDASTSASPLPATTGEESVAFAPGATVDDVLAAVDGRPGKKEGLATPGHGAVYFVILRDGERHGAAYRQAAFHVVIGAGVTLPEGALVIRRVWTASGQIDGMNEQPERFGVSVAVEPGAKKPYSAAVCEAAGTFVEALSRRVPLHPDCVLAMGEVAYANDYAADAAERELAKAARARVPAVPADGHLVVKSQGKEIPVDVERRNTTEGIEVGMMFRKGFDGENRGMLFEYPHADYHNFWMKNCPIPIDVAYINRGRIEQIWTMAPGFGLDQNSLRRYDSNSTLNQALEMPAGWFKDAGVKPGDEVTLK